MVHNNITNSIHSSSITNSNSVATSSQAQPHMDMTSSGIADHLDRVVYNCIEHLVIAENCIWNILDSLKSGQNSVVGIGYFDFLPKSSHHTKSMHDYNA